jgi:hypothetical protein
MLLCWGTDYATQLYQGAVTILISSSSIWMVGTRLQDCHLSVGLSTERATSEAEKKESASAKVLLAIAL